MLCPDAATHPGADKDPGCFHHPGFFLTSDVDKIALLKRFCGNDTIIVEVQIRTIAQDFWASLEHEIKYKKDIENSESLVQELKECADTIAETDRRIQGYENGVFLERNARK